MSTLRVDAIQNRTGGDLITAKGLARAWVNFNGTGTVSIRASMNVTSITDNGVGLYTVNFTTAMADSNYSMVAACSLDAVTGRQSRAVHPMVYSTTSMQINTVSTANSEDQLFVNLAFFD